MPGGKFATGLEAKCIAVAKARGTLVLEAHSVARVKDRCPPLAELS